MSDPEPSKPAADATGAPETPKSPSTPKQKPKTAQAKTEEKENVKIPQYDIFERTPTLSRVPRFKERPGASTASVPSPQHYNVKFNQVQPRTPTPHLNLTEEREFEHEIKPESPGPKYDITKAETKLSSFSREKTVVFDKSPRFPKGGSDSPGPKYDTLPKPAKPSPSKGILSSPTKRSSFIKPGPAPADYNIKEVTRQLAVSSPFKSTVSRDSDPGVPMPGRDSPGMGRYDAEKGEAKLSTVPKAPVVSLKQTSTRFAPNNKKDAPGPSSYIIKDRYLSK